MYSFCLVWNFYLKKYERSDNNKIISYQLEQCIVIQNIPSQAIDNLLLHFLVGT